MSVLYQDILQSLFIYKLQTPGVDRFESDPHEITEHLVRENKVPGYFGVDPELRSLVLCERIGVVVEFGAIVVGEEPLNIGMFRF